MENGSPMSEAMYKQAVGRKDNIWAGGNNPQTGKTEAETKSAIELLRESAVAAGHTKQVGVGEGSKSQQPAVLPETRRPAPPLLVDKNPEPQPLTVTRSVEPPSAIIKASPPVVDKVWDGSTVQPGRSAAETLKDHAEEQDRQYKEAQKNKDWKEGDPYFRLEKDGTWTEVYQGVVVDDEEDTGKADQQQTKDDRTQQSPGKGEQTQGPEVNQDKVRSAMAAVLQGAGGVGNVDVNKLDVFLSMYNLTPTEVAAVKMGLLALQQAIGQAPQPKDGGKPDQGTDNKGPEAVDPQKVKEAEETAKRTFLEEAQRAIREGKPPDWKKISDAWRVAFAVGSILFALDEVQEWIQDSIHHHEIPTLDGFAKWKAHKEEQKRAEAAAAGAQPPPPDAARTPDPAAPPSPDNRRNNEQEKSGEDWEKIGKRLAELADKEASGEIILPSERREEADLKKERAKIWNKYKDSEGHDHWKDDVAKRVGSIVKGDQSIAEQRRQAKLTGLDSAGWPDRNSPLESVFNELDLVIHDLDSRTDRTEQESVQLSWYRGVRRQTELAGYQAELSYYKGLKLENNPGWTQRIKDLNENIARLELLIKYRNWGSIKEDSQRRLSELGAAYVGYLEDVGPNAAELQAKRAEPVVNHKDTKHSYRENAPRWGLSVEDFDRWDTLEYNTAYAELLSLVNSLEVTTNTDAVVQRIEVMIRYISLTAAHKAGNGERGPDGQPLTMVNLLERVWGDRKHFREYFNNFDSGMRGDVGAAADRLSPLAREAYGGKFGTERLTRLWQESWPIMKALESDKRRLRKILDISSSEEERSILQKMADDEHVDISVVLHGYKVWRFFGRAALHDAWMDKAQKTDDLSRPADPNDPVTGYGNPEPEVNGKRKKWSGLRRYDKVDEGLSILFNYQRQAQKYEFGKNWLKRTVVDTGFRDFISFALPVESLGLRRNDHGIVEDLSSVDLSSLDFHNLDKDGNLLAGWLSAAKNAQETAGLLSKWLDNPTEESVKALRDSGWKHLFVGAMGPIGIAEPVHQDELYYLGLKDLKANPDGSAPPIPEIYKTLGARKWLKFFELAYVTLQLKRGVSVDRAAWAQTGVITDPTRVSEFARKLYVDPTASGVEEARGEFMMAMAFATPDQLEKFALEHGVDPTRVTDPDGRAEIMMTVAGKGRQKVANDKAKSMLTNLGLSMLDVIFSGVKKGK